MKKLLTFLLTVILLVAVNATALAVDAKPGDTVTITFRVEDNTAMILGTSINYDKDVLEYVSCDLDGAMQFDPAGGFVSMGGKITLGSITFLVKSNAPAGSYYVGGYAQGADMNGVKQTPSVTGGTVNVIVDAAPCDHSDTEWKETIKATCTKNGEKQLICSCGEVVKTEVIPATGHDNGEWATTKAAACTEAGEQTRKCTACGEALETKAIPAIGHDSGKWVVVKKATTTREGEKQLQCTKCSAVLQTEVIPMLEVIEYSMTACSIGPRFRDVSDITDEWDMFTPVDVSADGVQVYDLIAGNTHKVGTVTVKVVAGKVSVSYALNSDQFKVYNEFLTFLPALSEVTTITHNSLTAYAFDQEIDIDKELNGDTKVLLYVCNRIAYDSATKGIEGFSRNGDAYATLVEELSTLMD